MSKKNNNILIPIIGKLMPNIVAQDIVSVQPMSSNTGQVFNIKPKLLPKFQTVDGIVDLPDGYVVVSLSWEVAMWIQSTFPISEWKTLDGAEHIGSNVYVISKQAYTMLALRWS